MNCCLRTIHATSKIWLSYCRAGESPNVDRTPLYSGTSVTSDSSPFTPPVKAYCSTVGANSSPELDNVSPIYSGLATVGAGESLM